MNVRNEMEIEVNIDGQPFEIHKCKYICFIYVKNIIFVEHEGIIAVDFFRKYEHERIPLEKF